MDRTALTDVVRGHVATVLGVDEDEIDGKTDLQSEYGIDSLELMEIGTRLEAALGRRLDVEDLMTVRNVEDAIDLLQGHA